MMKFRLLYSQSSPDCWSTQALKLKEYLCAIIFLSMTMMKTFSLGVLRDSGGQNLC